MKLSIIGAPYRNAPLTSRRRVVVTFDPIKQVTIIDCDVDIVTLGLAVNVLSQEYEKYLKTLGPEIACQIRTTTKKVVQDYESN